MIRHSTILKSALAMAGGVLLAVPSTAAANAALPQTGLLDPAVTVLPSRSEGSAPAGEPRRWRIAQAETFDWSAIKTEAGIELSGDVPAQATRRFLAVRAGNVPADGMTVSEGAPDDFVDYSLAGLDALMTLKTGRVAYTGTRWILGGFAPNREALDATLAAFSAAVEPEDWLISVAVSPDRDADEMETATREATEDPAEDTAEDTTEDTAAMAPFTWAVRKEPGGGVGVHGMVPTDQMKRLLDVRSGDGMRNLTEVGDSTPPDDFVRIALVAMETISRLDQGRIGYTGTQWILGGFAPDRQALDAVRADLEAVADLSEWLVALEVSPAATQVAESGEDAPPEPAVDPDYAFSAVKPDSGPIALAGEVPADAFARYAGVISGGVPTHGLTVNQNAPEEFVTAATAGLRALVQLDTGRLAYAEGGWSLGGEARNQDTATAVTSALSGDDWRLDISVLPPIELCANAVAAFSDSHTILFAPASARLAGESASALVELADTLGNCPAARLDVEGHTDSDGPADANMALSVARAEAVIAELVELGLDETRLYAIGYGETLPVATNDTAAGKAENRRIVFKLIEE